MISIVKRKQACPTFVLGILGDYGRVESDLARTVERLQQIARRSDCRIVAAWEDSRWESVPLVQTLAMRFPESRLTAFCGDCPDQPARLFSAAAERAEDDFLHFLWPGCLPQSSAIATACRDLENTDLDWLGFVGPQAGVPELCSAEAEEHFYEHYLSCGRPLPLCQAVVRRTSFLGLNGFRTTPLLQRQFDADYWFRSLRRGQKGTIRAGNLAQSRWTWEDFPLKNDFRVPRYLSHSYRVRTADCCDDTEEAQHLDRFAADLPSDLKRTVARLEGSARSPGFRRNPTETPPRSLDLGCHRLARWSLTFLATPEPPLHELLFLFPGDAVAGKEEKRGIGVATACSSERKVPPGKPVALSSVRGDCGPFKIAVTGGTWEYLNNRLYFYNPFAELEGQGLFTYIPLLDSLLVPERDLRGVDLVIISRGRHANLRGVLDYCRQRSIPTLYMIDDNWFTVGKDWLDPPYASTFSPGLPQYEMFLSCLRECDAVMVYNDVLAEDVGRYARRVIRLPANVRPADFAAPLHHPVLKEQIAALRAWRQETGGLLAGYAGALRYRDGAFQALATVSQRTAPPVKVVLFGRVSSQQLEFFNDRAVVLPFVGYDAYAAALGALAPDILVAPLDRSRTSMSKCQIKYLDYSVAGAAGVYSATSPYSQAVADGKTGLLVREDDAASWGVAIARLIEDEALRRTIVEAARRDIREKYDTAVVAPAFAAALRSVIEGHRQVRNLRVKEPALC